MRDLFDAHIHYTFDIPLGRTVDIFRREFEAAGVTRGCFLSLPHHEKGGTVDLKSLQNIKALYLKRAFGSGFYAFAGLVHPQNYEDKAAVAADFLGQAEEYFASGYDGMKMLEGYPNLIKARGIPLDDEIYDLFYGFMEKNGYPIIMHIANPYENWDITKADPHAILLGRVYDETFPTKDEITAQVFGVMKKFPRLKLILAHMGFFSLEPHNAERFLGEYENTMLDTTPGDEQWIGMSRNWDFWLGFIDKYRDRIIYGTDFYAFPDDEKEKWEIAFMRRTVFLEEFFETDTEHDFSNKHFKGVDLPRDILRGIYRENAMRLLGEPKPISLEYMRSEVQRLRAIPDLQDHYADEDLEFIERSL